MALTSMIGRGLNPRPSDREPSTELLDNSFRHLSKEYLSVNERKKKFVKINFWRTEKYKYVIWAIYLLASSVIYISFSAINNLKHFLTKRDKKDQQRTKKMSRKKKEIQKKECRKKKKPLNVSVDWDVKIQLIGFDLS